MYNYALLSLLADMLYGMRRVVARTMQVTTCGEEDRPPVKLRCQFILDENGIEVIPDRCLRYQDELGTVVLTEWLEVKLEVLIFEILLLRTSRVCQAYKYIHIPSKSTLSQACSFFDLLASYRIDYCQTTSLDNARIYSKLRQARKEVNK